jgi:cytidyltransferase-like protein
MRSLFIGRYQPLHEGHIKLIRKVLDDEGKPVVVALRDTPIDESNPFTIEQRKEMFNKVFGDQVEIIVIPDIAEVCYGRKVGYKIRKIRLDKQIEEISATKIRNSRKRVIWLTGNTGAGKTALAYLLKERLNAIVLDGDEMRHSISLGAGFSKKDREEHNLRVARLAKVLNDQGQNVVVSVIAPYAQTRNKVDKICKPYWIYIRGGKVGKKYPYQIPKKPDVIIDPSEESLLESMEKIVKEVGDINGY